MQKQQRMPSAAVTPNKQTTQATQGMLEGTPSTLGLPSKKVVSNHHQTLHMNSSQQSIKEDPICKRSSLFINAWLALKLQIDSLTRDL